MNDNDLEGTLGAAMHEAVAEVSTSSQQRVRTVERARARRRRKAFGVVVSVVTVIAVSSVSLAAFNKKHASRKIDVINPSPSTTDRASISTSTSTSTTVVAAKSVYPELPVAPLTPRSGPLSAAIGKRFVMWGGHDEAKQLQFSDGAVYDTTTRQWQRMAASPLSSSIGLCGAAAAYGRNVFLLSNSSFAAYDIDHNTWHALPAMPVSIDSRTQGTGQCAGPAAGSAQRWFAVEASPGDGTNWLTWIDLAHPTGWHMKKLPSSLALTDSPVVIGDRAFVWGDQHGVSFELVTGSQAPLPDVPPFGRPFETIAYNGSEVVAESVYNGMIGYSPATGRYRLISRTLPFVGRPVEVGNQLVFAGGSEQQGDSTNDAITVFDTQSGSWRSLHRLAVPVRGEAALRIGSTIYIWGGETYAKNGITDPASSETRALDIGYAIPGP